MHCKKCDKGEISTHVVAYRAGKELLRGSSYLAVESKTITVLADGLEPNFATVVTIDICNYCFYENEKSTRVVKR